MKKIYLLIALIMANCVSQSLIAENKTLILYDIQADQQSGIIYSDQSFDITATHYTNLVMTGLTTLECLFDNGSRENLKYIAMYDETVNNTVDGGKAYIDILYKGNGVLKNIEFIGFGDGSSNSSNTTLYVGPNTIDNIPFYTGFDYSLQDGSTVEKNMAFYVTIEGYNGIEYACMNNSTKYRIPDTISTVQIPPIPPLITDYTDIRETIKNARLEWTSEKFASVTKIMGIKINYDDGNTVAIENEKIQDSDIIVTKQVGRYAINTMCQIQIYNMQGTMLGEIKNTDSINLDKYTKGIYIIRLKDNQNQATKTVKIVHND